MIDFNQVNVGTAATLVAAVVGPGATVVLTNSSASAVVYFGSGTTLTTANGFPLPPYGVLPMENVTSGSIYAITGTGTVPVGYLFANNY